MGGLTSEGELEVERGGWRLKNEPRRWQIEALGRWSDAYRGIVAVVTGAGKTFFAMQCMLSVRTSHPRCRPNTGGVKRCCPEALRVGTPPFS